MPGKPFIRDPSGILSRVPELEDIAEEDRRVLAAIESGEPHAIYWALRTGRLFRRIRRHAQTAKELLKNRRLFLVPARGRMWLSTYNGIGATFYGEGEPDLVDGSYIATHYLVAVFVPIFPLGQYLVRRATAESGGKGFFVLGRVPFNLALQLWSRIFTLLIFAGFVAALLSLLRSAQHNDFYVVNEIGAPIEARLAGYTIKVDSGSHEKVDLPTGNHRIEIFGAQGQKLETGTVQIRPGQQFIAWNVLGAAALVKRDIEYRAQNLGPPRPTPPQLHCGDRNVVYRRIDHLFTDPPQSLRTRGSSETRSHLFVGRSGPDTCLRYLADESRRDDLVALAVGNAQAMDFAAPVLETDVDLLSRLGTDDAAIELARQGRAKHPTSVEHHRIYQDALAAAGKSAQVRREYAAELPLSAGDRAYLTARLETSIATRTRLALELSAKYPEHATVLAWSASVLCAAGEFARAVTLYARLQTLDPAMHLHDTTSVVTALVGAGQAQAALSTITAASESGFGENALWAQLVLAELYASVAQKVKDSDGELLIRRFDSENATETRAYAKLLAALPPEDDAQLSAEMRAKWNTQEQLLADAHALATIDGAALRDFPAPNLLLFFAEAVRQHIELAKTLRASFDRMYSPRFVQNVLHYVEHGGELEMYDAGSRATLLFVRSRATTLPDAERKALRKDAERLAVLPGLLTRAMTNWSAPEKAEKPAKPAKPGNAEKTP